MLQHSWTMTSIFLVSCSFLCCVALQQYCTKSRSRFVTRSTGSYRHAAVYSTQRCSPTFGFTLLKNIVVPHAVLNVAEEILQFRTLQLILMIQHYSLTCCGSLQFHGLLLTLLWNFTVPLATLNLVRKHYSPRRCS